MKFKVAHVGGEPCRATRVAASFLGFSMCGNGIVLSPLKGPVAPVAPVTPVVHQRPGVSHVKLPPKGVALQGGATATLASVTLHCPTMITFQSSQS